MQDHQHRRGLAVKPEGQWQRRPSRATVVARRSSRGSRGRPAARFPTGTTGELNGYEFLTALRLATPQIQDRRGKALVLLVTAGERHDQTLFEPLLEQGQVRRDGRGRPRRRPGRIVGDKGCSSRRIRNWLRRQGIGHTIPHQRNECRSGPFDRALYRERNQVERLSNRLKQFRRVATRYEKRAANYLALVTLAVVLLWLALPTRCEGR